MRFARRPRLAVALGLLATACSGNGGADDSPGNGGDANGIKGGTYAFDVTVDDAAFAPGILKCENLAHVTVTLHNAGTKPHDFVVDKIAAGNIAPLDPGATATVTFDTPDTEGIYVFRSTQAGDSQTGQILVE